VISERGVSISALGSRVRLRKKWHQDY